ncbi:MAG: hypothetical protein P1V97_35895, partial [Planctomycetota bacterium]|nr:hypothetical protein [Planctomycetota bacterium]
EKKDFVFFIIMLSVCFFPINKAGAVWKETARAKDLVRIVDANKETITLQFCSETAYLNISAALDRRV